ncbi:glucuronide permease [Streptococcus sp. zg-86]|uniref:Glucuronide permease n=1 Tax=Streptococcus zhangguiae TaxID=2664091 RepID=A0A6I4RJ21_9STRE|nr:MULTISPECIES: MFS transporter [unclassified Streptococcus]MTB64526.1 glucuronide permease [Streptococcus sp. zg-86]MTB90784.1 glucuronide permease [Streptococcus sp. zg-36]MWV56513.1 glucuronide permease [Streptococcus sp. zg-70]QTH47281.1 MFS transporter [Streptococcus sp. zg-86]
MDKTVEQRTADVTYNRAKLWQIILFATNNTSTNIYLVAFSFVTYFSTGVLGLAVLFVSQLMGYIRIFDGFIDPAIGVLIDKTDTKFGKYRPILVLGNIITALSFVFLFNIHHFGSAMTMPLFIVALLIHKIGYSLQQTITKAGQTALTNDPKQRPIFNIVDGIMSAILFSGSQIVISSYLVPKHGGFTEGFFAELMLGVISISAVLAVLSVIGIWQKDNKKYFGLGEEKTQKTTLKDYWKIIKGNRPLQVLSISAALVKFVAQLFSDSVVVVMLFGILFGNYALSGAISGLMVIPNILVIVSAATLARKKGLRKAYVTSLQIGIVVMILLGTLLYFGGPGSLDFVKWNLYSVAFVVLYALRSFATAPSGLVLTMGADISDYETSVSGRYVSGMIGTIFSLTDSIASSFAPMVVGFVLAGIGFAKAYPTAETPLSPALKGAIITLLVFVPAAMLLISLFLMKFYTLDQVTMAQVQEKIHVMKAAKDEERVQAIAKNVPLSDMDYVDVTKYDVEEK